MIRVHLSLLNVIMMSPDTIIIVHISVLHVIISFFFCFFLLHHSYYKLVLYSVGSPSCVLPP